MKAAGLKAIDTVVSSTAILVKSKNPSNPAMVDLIAARIKGVISKPSFLLFLLPFSPTSSHAQIPLPSA
jgi:ATP phosphoribosyltransferase